MNTDAILWRVQVLKSKAMGELPSWPWSKVPSILAKPFESWDYSYFATPLSTDRDLVQYQTPIGKFWGRHEDRSSIGVVVVEELCNIYSKSLVSVRPGDVVIDLGAHLGTFVRVALNSGARLVVAFEANAANANALRVTFRTEIADKKVVIIQSPVWSDRRTVHFSGHGLVGMVCEEGESMQTVTIDDVIRELGVTKVDFIKTDIEGAERYALEGAATVLSSHAPKLAVSTYHLPDDPSILKGIVLKHHPYHVQFDKGKKRMLCYPATA